MNLNSFSLKTAVYPFLVAVYCIYLASGCQSAPQRIETPDKTVSEGNLPDLISDKIEGIGRCTADQLATFFLAANPTYPAESIRELAGMYITECQIENINSDIAFCQMCHETGYLTFGNLVTAEMNNFCGLGAINAEQRGCIFNDRQSGVRAHVQHLKAYGSSKPLVGDCIDPRYKYVQPKGKAPSFYDLAKSWAADPDYGKRLEEKLTKLYTVNGLLK